MGPLWGQLAITQSRSVSRSNLKREIVFDRGCTAIINGPRRPSASARAGQSSPALAVCEEDAAESERHGSACRHSADVLGLQLARSDSHGGVATEAGLSIECLGENSGDRTSDLIIDVRGWSGAICSTRPGPNWSGKHGECRSTTIGQTGDDDPRVKPFLHGFHVGDRPDHTTCFLQAVQRLNGIVKGARIE